MRNIQRYRGHLKLTEFHMMVKGFLVVVIVFAVAAAVTVRLSATCLFAFSVITSLASITEIFLSYGFCSF